MNHEYIQIALGQTFEVALKETSSSGYLWRVSFLPGGLELADTAVDPPSWRSPVGAEGYRRYLFRALHPGTFTLRFDLRREWEEKALQHHVVKVSVGKSDS